MYTCVGPPPPPPPKGTIEMERLVIVLHEFCNKIIGVGRLDSASAWWGMIDVVKSIQS